MPPSSGAPSTGRAKRRDEKPLPKSGYRFLAGIIASVHRHGGPLAEALDAPHRKGGRRGYGAMAKLTAAVLQHVLNIRYANRFLNELNANPKLLAMCGMDQAPDEGTYSRFKKALTEYVDDVDLIMAQVVRETSNELERLREVGIVPADAPQLGHYLAVDSSDIEAYGNPKRKRPRDPDAAWGYRTPKNKSSSTSKKKGELFYGYKVHEAVDAYYGLPLAGITLPANEGDGPQLPKVLDRVQKLHPWMKPQYGIADKAYAGQERLQQQVDRGLIPVVAVPKPPKDDKGRRLFDGLYTADGRLTCEGNVAMDYLGYEPERGHRFRCPDEGCALKDKIGWSRHCDSEVWEKPEGRLLRTIGLLPRFTEKWKGIYRMRTWVERYFRSGKHARLLDRHQFMGIAKVGLHVKISRLAYLATALARLRADDYAGMRHMTVHLPRLRPEKAEAPPEMACQDANCTCCSWWREAA